MNGGSNLYLRFEQISLVPDMTLATNLGLIPGQMEEEVGRQRQGMDRPWVRQVPEGSGEEGKMEETGCEIICGAPTTLAVKG